MHTRPIYLDCNATTPIEPEVADLVQQYLLEEYGNAGSRSHEYGSIAEKAIRVARQQIATLLDVESFDVIFTSGATESNNLAIFGLQKYAFDTGKKHIICSEIEHKSVLGPAQKLCDTGFEVTYLPSNRNGTIEVEELVNTLRSDTLLVSIMHVNNETGVVQPLADIADILEHHEAYFHVDAAQGFGKELTLPRLQRIDLISISGHKIYGPKGIGALALKRRDAMIPPIEPLIVGGGQERGLRSGTLPVPLIAGFGLAAEIAERDHTQRSAACRLFRDNLIKGFVPLNPIMNGAREHSLPHTINIQFPGLHSEAVMLTLRDIVAISDGSACTSQEVGLSHVLLSMGLPRQAVECSTRWSWWHNSEEPDWNEICSRLIQLRKVM